MDRPIAFEYIMRGERCRQGYFYEFEIGGRPIDKCLGMYTIGYMHKAQM